MSPCRACSLAAAVFFLFLILAALPIEWPLDDFAEYWAAGRLNASGHNPYEPAAMLLEEREIGWQHPDPDMMYNPPWTLALAMPIGAVNFQIARSIWLPVQLVITLWCASTLWILYGGSPIHRARACGLALVWMPFVPWTIVERRWKVLAGAIGAVAAASLVPMSTNPRVFGQYQYLIASVPPTLTFESPNLATIFRAAMGTASSWPQFVPTCLGAVLVGLMWFRTRADWDWTSQLRDAVWRRVHLARRGRFGRKCYCTDSVVAERHRDKQPRGTETRSS